MGSNSTVPPIPHTSLESLHCSKIVEQLPFGMIWVDDRGAITWANDHQRDFTGRRGCELIGVSALQDPVLVSTGLADYLNLIFETPPTQWQSCPPRQELSDAQMGKSFTFQFYPIIEATVLRGVAILLLPKPTGKTEQVASLHRAQLNALLTIVQEPCFFIDRRFQLGKTSDSILRLLGKDRTGQGQTCYQALFQRQSRCERCPAAKVFETGSSEYKLPQPPLLDAAYYCAQALAVSQDDEGISHVCLSLAGPKVGSAAAMVHELNELSALNLLYRDLLDALPGIAVVIDARQQIVAANAAFYRAQGKHLSQVLGTHLFSFQPYKGVAHLQERIQKCFAGEEQEIELAGSADFPFYRHRIKRLGKFVDLQVVLIYSESIQGFRDQSSQFSDFVSVQKMSDFIGRFAHDLKNPLSVMMGQLDLLRMYEIGESSENKELAAELDMVNNNTIKMQKIIERAAMLQNHQPDDLQRIQASSLLDKVITMAHIQRPHKDVCIEWSVAADMPDLTVCEARIEIALMELIRNALEAAGPSGTVTLRAFYQSESEQFVFQLANSGQTIAADRIAQVMQPFYSSRKELGAGLGLPIAHAIAVSHHGQLKISSDPEQGTVVTLSLPRFSGGAHEPDNRGRSHGEPNVSR